jgi:hypothetical protein
MLGHLSMLPGKPAILSLIHFFHIPCCFQVLVFNCDEEFDVTAMGRIFVGLLRCGAWGCFDEFNRLGEDVLSAVSQQVQSIQVRPCYASQITCM